MRVRTDVTRLQQSVQRLQGSVEAGVAASTTRTREQVQQTEQQVGALSRRLESLATSVTTLSARVDELSTRLDSQARQSRACRRPPPSVRRVRAPSPLPGAPVPPATESPEWRPRLHRHRPSAAQRLPPAPIPPTASRGSRPEPAPGGIGIACSAADSPTAPQDAYQAAYIDFSKGSYPIAITGFREFVRRYPDHPLAGSAQYWVGEAQLGLARGQANAGQTEQVDPGNGAGRPGVQEGRGELPAERRKLRPPSTRRPWFSSS